MARQSDLIARCCDEGSCTCISALHCVFYIVRSFGIGRADIGTRLIAMGWLALVYMHTMLLYCSNCIVNQLPSLIGAFFSECWSSLSAIVQQA